MVPTQQPEAVVLQSGQGGNGEGLHVFGRHCFSARSDDTDRWFECDFVPAIAVQGVSQRVRQPKKVCAAEWKSFCGSPLSGGGFLQFVWMWPRGETAISVNKKGGTLEQTSVKNRKRK